MLKVKKLSKIAKAPTKGSREAAGYDLYSAEECFVPKRSRKLIKTDISISIPPYTYARIAPRSGNALNFGIDVGAGIIDSDYRGNIAVLLFNHSNENFKIKIGDRIAQMIIHIIITPEVSIVDELDLTDRDSGGFGSTGK